MVTRSVNKVGFILATVVSLVGCNHVVQRLPSTPQKPIITKKVETIYRVTEGVGKSENDALDNAIKNGLYTIDQNRVFFHQVQTNTQEGENNYVRFVDKCVFDIDVYEVKRIYSKIYVKAGVTYKTPPC